MSVAVELAGLPAEIQIRAILAYYLPEKMCLILGLARKFEPFYDGSGKGIRVDSRNDITNSRILKEIYQGAEVRSIPAELYKYTAAMLQGFRAWTGYGQTTGPVASEHSISNLVLTVEELARACAANLKCNAPAEPDSTSEVFRLTSRRNTTTIKVINGGGKVANELACIRKEVEKLGLSKIRFTEPGSDKVISAEEFVQLILKEIRTPGIGRTSPRHIVPSNTKNIGNLTYIAGGDEYKKLDQIISERIPGADNPFSEHIELKNGEILRVKDRTLRKILHQLAALAQFQGNKVEHN